MVAGFGKYFFQRALYAVVDRADQPWSQFHAQRSARKGDRLTGADAVGVLIDLDGGHLFVKLNDLAHQPLRSHLHHFIH